MTSTSHDVISSPLFYRNENVHSHARLHYNIFTSTRAFSTIIDSQQLSTPLYILPWIQRKKLVLVSFDFICFYPKIKVI